MQPLAVDAALLKTLLASDLSAEVKLSVGRELMARVADLMGGGRGTISLAGMMLDAELPDNVRIGDELRLQVSDLTPEKVVLTIQGDAAQAAPAQAANQQITPEAALAQAPLVPMPTGGSLQVSERDAGGGGADGDGAHQLKLRYEAPALGMIELHFTLTPGALAVNIGVAASAYTLTNDQAPALAQALTAAAERPAKVTVTPRREPLDVFA